MSINLTAVCITAIICLTVGSIFNAAIKNDDNKKGGPKE